MSKEKLAIHADICARIDPDRNIGGPYFMIEGWFYAYDLARINSDGWPEYVYQKTVRGILTEGLTFKGRCSRESVERDFERRTEPTVY